MLDEREFRRTLGCYATGVAIVTAYDADARAGVTINSFSSLSLRPPLVLFSLTRNLRSLAVFERAGCIGISVLSTAQQEISSRFATAGADKWSGIPTHIGQTGALLIGGAIAHLECDRHSIVEGGDHLIFICRVVGFDASRGEPLLFYQGGYARAALDAGQAVSPKTKQIEASVQ